MKRLEKIISSTRSFIHTIEGGNVVVFKSELEDLTGKLEEIGFEQHYYYDAQIGRHVASNQWCRGEDGESVFVSSTNDNTWTYATEVGVCGIESFGCETRYILS